jgi:hypothetical protein
MMGIGDDTVRQKVKVGQGCVKKVKIKNKGLDGLERGRWNGW